MLGGCVLIVVTCLLTTHTQHTHFLNVCRAKHSYSWEYTHTNIQLHYSIQEGIPPVHQRQCPTHSHTTSSQAGQRHARRIWLESVPWQCIRSQVHVQSRVQHWILLWDPVIMAVWDNTHQRDWLKYPLVYTS